MAARVGLERRHCMSGPRFPVAAAVAQADLYAQARSPADELEEDEAPAIADTEGLRRFLGPAPA